MTLTELNVEVWYVFPLALIVGYTVLPEQPCARGFRTQFQVRPHAVVAAQSLFRGGCNGTPRLLLPF
eukprot:2045049-Pyramimonas_sp.AAC.1